MDQQQKNKEGVFVEYSKLDNSIFAAEFSSLISFLIFIIALVGMSITSNMGLEFGLGIIAIAAFLSGLLSAYSSSELSESKPKKVKKIIKVTTIYENGIVEERERRYEY